jgi:hypothetical protein
VLNAAAGADDSEIGTEIFAVFLQPLSAGGKACNIIAN